MPTYLRYYWIHYKWKCWSLINNNSEHRRQNMVWITVTIELTALECVHVIFFSRSHLCKLFVSWIWLVMLSSFYCVIFSDCISANSDETIPVVPHVALLSIQATSPERRFTQKEIIAGEERPKYLLIKQHQEAAAAAAAAAAASAAAAAATTAGKIDIQSCFCSFLFSLFVSFRVEITFQFHHFLF